MKFLFCALNGLSLARFAGGAFGSVAAMLVLATPGWLFERIVMASKLSSMIAAQGPWSGLTARTMAAMATATLATVTAWGGIATLGAVAKKIRQSRPEHDDGDGPALPVTTTDVQAPGSRRRPIFAGSDLGAPFMSDEAIGRAEDELLLETLAPDEAPFFSLPTRERSRQPVAALLERLEAALEQRRDPSEPVRPGGFASLHATLGESIRYH